jgi:hypothetical protein
MSKEQEYRDHAFTTIELAKRVNNPADRNRQLMLAEAWIELAEKTAKAAKIKFRRVFSDQSDENVQPVTNQGDSN